MKKILLSLALMLVCARGFAQVPVGPTPAPPHGQNVWTTGGDPLHPVPVSDSAATSLALEFAAQSGYSTLRNQMTFRDGFHRPNSTSINTGIFNSAWEIASPGSSIGVTNNYPYAVTTNDHDIMLQENASPNAFIEITLTQEFIDANEGIIVRGTGVTFTDGYEIDSLGNGAFTIYDLGEVAEAQTRISQFGQTVGAKFGVELKGRIVNFYLNRTLFDTINLDTAGFNHDEDAATKFGLALYGENGSVPTFLDFEMDPFKQEFLNPTPTPFVVTVIPPTQVVGTTPVTLMQATPGWKNDAYLTINNGNDSIQYVGQLNTGNQYYGDFRIQPGLGLQQMLFIDAIGNTSTVFTGHAAVTTNLGGFIVGHP